MEETNNNKKFIYTDSYRTKDILWEAYTGFIDAYNNFQMLKTLQRIDPITMATMNKYAIYFYDEVQDFLNEFKENINNIQEIQEIFKQQEIRNEDYITLRHFFATFMKISGIKNIVKEKDDPHTSVEMNR